MKAVKCVAVRDHQKIVTIFRFHHFYFREEFEKKKLACNILQNGYDN